MPLRGSPQLASHVNPTDRDQEPPNALQIELVEGCSLACRFCGVQGIRAGRGDYKFMAGGTAAAIVSRLGVAMREYGWNPRVEFAMHGEPTMHPNLIDMATLFGSVKPRELILVSNGTGLVRDPNGTIAALFAAGVTSICLDQYDGCDYVPRALARYAGPVPVRRYSGAQSEKFRGHRPGDPVIVVKEDVSHLVKPYDKLNTHCGGGGPPAAVNPALGKRCAKPFRELSVRWDGNVALCCNDFRGIYKVANVCDHATLDGLWQHPRLAAARRVLYAADRDFIPCRWCDALSPRVGLLPDKYGKATLPAPTAATRAALAEAVAGEPYAVPVLRGWEQNGGACLPPLVQLGVLRRQPLDAGLSAG